MLVLRWRWKASEDRWYWRWRNKTRHQVPLHNRRDHIRLWRGLKRHFLYNITLKSNKRVQLFIFMSFHVSQPNSCFHFENSKLKLCKCFIFHFVFQWSSCILGNRTQSTEKNHECKTEVGQDTSCFKFSSLEREIENKTQETSNFFDGKQWHWQRGEGGGGDSHPPVFSIIMLYIHNLNMSI